MEEEFYLCENEEDVNFIVNYLENKKDTKYFIYLSIVNKKNFIDICIYHLEEDYNKSNQKFYISFKDGYLDFGFSVNITGKSVKLMRRKEKLIQL
jgi:hypothetical protein